MAERENPLTTRHPEPHTYQELAEALAREKEKNLRLEQELALLKNK